MSHSEAIGQLLQDYDLGHIDITEFRTLLSEKAVSMAQQLDHADHRECPGCGQSWAAITGENGSGCDSCCTVAPHEHLQLQEVTTDMVARYSSQDGLYVLVISGVDACGQIDTSLRLLHD